MKFNLPNEEIKVDAKEQQVHLPLKRFAELMDYVEEVESRLLAAEINLREADRLTSEMEKLTSEIPAAPLSSQTAENVQRALSQLPAQIQDMMQSKNISIRKLSMASSIPYATLHRYLKGGSPLGLKHAATIMEVMQVGGKLASAASTGEYVSPTRAIQKAAVPKKRTM